MERNIKKTGLVNLVVLLAVGVASLVLARYTNTQAGQAGVLFLGLGFLVLAIGYFQMRLEETERLERMEFEELNKTAATASLFNTTDAEVFPAKRSREQFERFFVPGFTVLLLLLQAGGAWWLFYTLRQTVSVGALTKATVGMALFGLFALILFLLGKYAVGLSRSEGGRLLRPGASYMLMCAYVCFLITACMAAVEMGFPRVDYYAAYVLAGVLALIAAETLINLVLEIYRPRVAGRPGRLLYDSRLVGLLAEPEGLFTTAAHALDYQFGFKVSETWFYRFLQRALTWIILLQLAVLLASTCFVFIGPGEQGLMERFGHQLADRAVLEPGLHVKLPWPIDQVYRFRTREIQSFNIGFVPEDEATERAVLWTGKHYKEESNWLVAGGGEAIAGDANAATNNAATDRGIPADLVNLSVPVQFHISDVRAWAYNHTDAAKVLEQLATREVVRYLAGIDLLQLMTAARSQAAEELRKRIQEQADTLSGGSLGVQVVLVGLQDLHPPAKVAPKFEEVLATLQENEARIHQANGYAMQTVTLARAEAHRRVNEAQSFSNRIVTAASANASQFANQMLAYQASPKVYRQRAYLQALERGMTNARKYVLAISNRNDLVELNLEDKIREDFLNGLTVPPPK
jgi:HflK protein